MKLKKQNKKVVRIQQKINYDELLEKFIEVHKNKFIIFVLIISVLLAYYYRFIQDDAFISFVYAKNLIEGKGLTWFGNHIEGYTNFLWVIWVATGLFFKADPVWWTYITGIILFASTVYIIWYLSFIVFKSRLISLLSVILTITNYSMVCYATGGLETILQTFLIILIAYISCRILLRIDNFKVSFVFLSLISSLSVLTRMDSIIPVAIMFIFISYYLYKNKSGFIYYVFLFLPFVLICGIWLLWKLFYYGRILPNTYYVKVSGETEFNYNGITYLTRYINWYILWIPIIISIVIWTVKKIKAVKGLRFMISTVIFWYLYVMYVGGDFMEFRFFIPVTPLMFIILSYLIYNVIGSIYSGRKVIISALFLLLLIRSSYIHSRDFKTDTEDHAIDSIEYLKTFYGIYQNNNWDTIGKRLKEEFKNRNIVIALHPVGAIVFYSGLQAVDMLGLNEPETEKNFIIRDGGNLNRPGHRLIAKFSYLEEKKVSFIISHPFIVDKGFMHTKEFAAMVRQWISIFISDNNFPLKEARFVGLPLSPYNQLVMIYITQTHEIDSLIQARGYETETIKFSK